MRRLIGPAVRVTVASALAIAAMLAVATPAWAHSRLEHTSPVDGSTIAAPMSSITLTFNERVHGDFTTVVVEGPGGVSYSRGHVRVVDDNVFQDVYPLRSGAYAVSWRAVSADGHPVDGQFRFTVALPAGQEPASGPPTAVTVTADASNTDLWVWIVVAAAVVAIAGVLVAFGRRRRRAMSRGDA
jgi:methionine-rich copper-binding protein CopC